MDSGRTHPRRSAPPKSAGVWPPPTATRPGYPGCYKRVSALSTTVTERWASSPGGDGMTGSPCPLGDVLPAARPLATSPPLAALYRRLTGSGAVRVLTVLDAFRLGGAETLIAQLARVADHADLELDVLSLHGPSEDRSKLAPMLAEAGAAAAVPGRDDGRSTRPPSPGWLRRIRRDQAGRGARPPRDGHDDGAAGRRAGRPAGGRHLPPCPPAAGRPGRRPRAAGRRGGNPQRGARSSSPRPRSTSFADRYRRGSAAAGILERRPQRHRPGLLHHPSAAGDWRRMPADLGLTGRRVVTIVAALRDFKGIIHAVQAWPTWWPRYPDARLLLVGTGTEEASLRREVGYRQVTRQRGLRRHAYRHPGRAARARSRRCCRRSTARTCRRC